MMTGLFWCLWLNMKQYFCLMNFDEQLRHLIEEALKEDIGDGDHSTLACIEPLARGKAVLKIKEKGILAGMDVARVIFQDKEPGAVFTPFKKDGDEMEKGEIAFEVEALVHSILQCERLVLNCMQRMSGIATLTRQYTEKLNGFKTRLLDTRKTTPNFRLLEKEAVRIGGGVNHRFGLYDMIMLKDNHIDYCGGIEKTISKAWDYVQSHKPGLKPAQVKEAVDLIGDLFETEASGGINLDNIETYAATGVDFVSVGALIHQARSLDLSLKASPNPSTGGASDY